MSEQSARSKTTPSSWLSRLLRLLVLLTVVGVSAGSYLLVWPEVETFLAKQAEVEKTLASLSKADAALEKKLTALIDSKVENSEDATLAAMQSTETRLASELNAVRDVEQRAVEKLNEAHHLLYLMKQTDQRAWQLAEATFNIRLASQRLQFAADVDGALTLLSQADGLLQNRSDERASAIRQAIAFDRAQLRTVDKVDVVGLMGRLAALDRQIQTLDLTTFDPSMPGDKRGDIGEKSGTERASDIAVPKSLWERAVEKLASYFVITDVESSTERPRSADRARFVIASMKLNIEQARVALLARDSENFTAAISRASDRLAGALVSIDDPIAVVVLEELVALGSIPLALQLPELEALKVVADISNKDVAEQHNSARSVGNIEGQTTVRAPQ